MANEDRPQEEKESSLILALRDFKEGRDYHSTMFREARLLGRQEEAQRALDNFYECVYRQTGFYEKAVELTEQLARKYLGKGEEILLEMAECLRTKKSELTERLNKFALEIATAQ